MLKTLQSYLPSFSALILFSAVYTALVFSGTTVSDTTLVRTPSSTQRPHQSQNFNVAKKLNAEKLSTEFVKPDVDVASPFETE